MATARCACLRFLLTGYVCDLNVVCVSLLYDHLLVVVCMLVVYYVFCLSEAGSARGHLSAAREGFSLSLVVRVLP